MESCFYESIFEEGGDRSARRKPSKSGWDRLKLNPHTTFVEEVEGMIDVHCASLTSQGVQHRVSYLDGCPSRYQPPPTGLNFGEQTGTGVFPLVIAVPLAIIAVSLAIIARMQIIAVPLAIIAPMLCGNYLNYCFMKNLDLFRTTWPISIVWLWRPRRTTGNRHRPWLSWRQKKCLRVYHLWKPATQESPEYFSWSASVTRK